MSRRALPLLGLISLAAAASCGRTGFGEQGCPAGTVDDGRGTCVCSTDDGCPSGYACDAGLCVCRGDTCCPAGHVWDGVAKGCRCVDASCCPQDFRYDEVDHACACNASSCCPIGYRFDEERGRCTCASDRCCPQNTLWSEEVGLCVCAAQECCPDGYEWDSGSRSCLCADDACCPEGHVYNRQLKACECEGDGCCPLGFHREGDRCLCDADEACPGNLHCADDGRCLCASDDECEKNQFCNPEGFCQTLSNCESNEDCPAATFCDVEATPPACVRGVECARDLHCPLGQVCSATGACVGGCKDTSGCPLGEMCQDGKCLAGCEANDFCGYDEVCNRSHQCIAGDTVNCALSCTPDGPGGSPCRRAGGNCLGFVIEGQKQYTFCASPCDDDTPCPGGFTCGPVIHGCGGGGGFCADTPDGQSTACREYRVVNQEGTSWYCTAAGETQPAHYESYCAPSPGYCPEAL